MDFFIYEHQSDDKQENLAKEYLHNLYHVRQRDQEDFHPGRSAGVMWWANMVGRGDGWRLLCEYEGKTYLVNGYSTVGCLYLKEDLKDIGYDKRVDWRKCSNWRIA